MHGRVYVLIVFCLNGFGTGIWRLSQFGIEETRTDIRRTKVNKFMVVVVLFIHIFHTVFLGFKLI